MGRVRALGLLAVLGLGGCLSILEPPHAAGGPRDPPGPCSASRCPGGYWCADFDTCATSCADDEDCRPGWACCERDELDSGSAEGCRYVDECFEL